MNMKFIRKLIGSDETFYDLLEASSKEAESSVQLLVQLLKNPGQGPALDEFIQTRRKDKRITEQISEQLCKTFVTPLVREDIEALSTTLYKIPKIVEKFSEKFILCSGHVREIQFDPQVELLSQSTATVVKMVGKLRQRANLEEIKELNDRLHYFEGEADKIMLHQIKDLYSGQHDPLKVIVAMDLYETLEKVIDRCRDSGNVIFQIVLKYS
jgi:uncharacterized protein Yka (UPF0111/DUF47 family)